MKKYYGLKSAIKLSKIGNYNGSLLWSMSGHLTSFEKISISKTMKIKKCKKMPLSLASSSDVARILAMTHKDTIDL